MKKRIKIQKIKVIQFRKDSSHTEQSSYWDSVNSGGRSADTREHPQANPDVLPETGTAAPSTPQLIMGEAVDHLQGRQREIYMLIMRDNKSLAEAAEVLGIEKGSAQKYKERAIKFIGNWCKQAMAKGRV